MSRNGVTEHERTASHVFPRQAAGGLQAVGREVQYSVGHPSLCERRDLLGELRGRGNSAGVDSGAGNGVLQVLPPNRGGDHRSARHSGVLLPADDRRLSAGRRRLYRGDGQSRRDAGSCGRCGIDHRVHLNRGRERLRGRGGGDERVSGAAQVEGADCADSHCAADLGQPARSARERGHVRRADVSLHLHNADADRRWYCALCVRKLYAAGSSHCRLELKGHAAVCDSARLCLRLHGADRRRGRLERRAEL